MVAVTKKLENRSQTQPEVKRPTVTDIASTSLPVSKLAFTPPSMKSMVTAKPNSSTLPSLDVLIINDSFPRIMAFKDKHKQFPDTWNSMLTFMTKAGGDRDFYFDGKLLLKRAVDLVIADFLDGCHVPGISTLARDVPH
ncbi:hypothetical protein KC19_VG212800 [Ceratodon purpureus]|uniref:Uncharacterized protein n=1 Tax=Ceratodon purpureus TaxID=3225 RepID=A0A8T0HSQ5_CERPU|nr:hypothetical protein KC19_VG212800 [Ceratodon purpureus]